MTIRFSKWRHDDSRTIVRDRDSYVGCLQKRGNGWAPSLDLMTALKDAGDFRSRAGKDWRSELEAIREIQEILSSSPESQSRPVQERHKLIRRIVQQDSFGSGIACVAMLTGKSYRSVAKEMFPDGVVSGTNTGDLRRALAASRPQGSPVQADPCLFLLAHAGTEP